MKYSQQYTILLCFYLQHKWLKIIKMPLGREVGLDPINIVSDRDPAPLPRKGYRGPQFSAHVYCGQTAGRIKMPLGTEVGNRPGDSVLAGYPVPPKRGIPPNFRPMSIVAKRLDASGYHLVRR